VQGVGDAVSCPAGKRQGRPHFIRRWLRLRQISQYFLGSETDASMQAADSPIAHALRTQATVQPGRLRACHCHQNTHPVLAHLVLRPSALPLSPSPSLTCTPSSSALLVDSGCNAAARVERSARLRGCSRWPSLPSGRAWPPGRLFSRAPCHRRRIAERQQGIPVATLSMLLCTLLTRPFW
jgi:hypothetical protein